MRGRPLPFIANYRKEITGGLDDGQLRKPEERLGYLHELEEKFLPAKAFTAATTNPSLLTGGFVIQNLKPKLSTWKSNPSFGSLIPALE